MTALTMRNQTKRFPNGLARKMSFVLPFEFVFRRYCGIQNPACVVKCLSTQKWFCNSRISGLAGSCAVVHLVKSKCKEVQLHRDSPLPDTVLECYATGTRNVFALGFVPVKSENTVVLISREVQSSHPVVKDLDLDLSLWQPIIEERAFVPWLVREPSEHETLRARQVTIQQINRLEELWKSDPNVNMDELDKPGMDQEPTPVALKYEDADEYKSVFFPLIQMEADHDKAVKESQSRDNISVRWDIGLNKKHLAYFYFSKDSTELRLMPGDELRLKHPAPNGGAPWESTGSVIRLDATEEVCLEMKTTQVPDDVKTGFVVEYVWKATSFQRMTSALKTFAEEETSVSGYLYHKLLGHDLAPQTLKVPLPSTEFSINGLPELNHSQIHAVRSVIQQPLSLIQGPPGTGKTVTTAAIVYHLSTLCHSQVLVAAPSNVAVDQLAEKICATGLKVVRVCAKSRESLGSPVEHLTLHYQVNNLRIPGKQDFQKLQQLKNEKGELDRSDEKRYKHLRKMYEKEILQNADVVCSTCVGAGDPRLAHFRFKQVLIDEATQATEPECLIPMVMGVKQVVLVGDHCQLGPVIMHKAVAKAGLSQSLFERLMLLGIKPIRLQVQYRMHPCLSEFPSDTFYEGSLQNGIPESSRIYPGVNFPWPVPEKPMMFYIQLGSEEISASGTSYLNRTEAVSVEKVISTFLQGGVMPKQIGVITPYEGQRAHVMSVIQRLGTQNQHLCRELEVASVDSFQGREKDFIILSCVRSNERQGIGFLSDAKRLNVALTRCRFGLVILGNPKVLSRDPLWNKLLVHFKERGCLVEGSMKNLKQSLVQLSKPTKTFNRRKFGLGGAFSINYKPTPVVSPLEEALEKSCGINSGPPQLTGPSLTDPLGNGSLVGHPLPPSPSPYAIPEASRKESRIKEEPQVAESSQLFPDINTQVSFDFLDDLPTQDQQFSQCPSDAFFDKSQLQGLYGDHSQIEDESRENGGPPPP